MKIKTNNRKIAGFTYNEDSGILMIFEESGHVSTYRGVFFESKEFKNFSKDMKIQRTIFSIPWYKIRIFTIWKDGESTSKVYFVSNPR
jgi:hypothetical protein